MSPAIGLNICATITRIKKYKSIVKKKKMKHDKIVLLAKTNLNCIRGLTCRSLIDSYIGYDDFLLINGVLRKYDYMNEEIKNLKT